MQNAPVVILGGGPAGLASAHELVKAGVTPVVLEKGDKVGGIARTESYKGYHFDIGGHRFFTKIDLIGQLWRDMLGDDFIKVSRMSRIYYEGRFYSYPLSIFNTLSNLGPVESARILFSYFRALVLPHREEETFEQWVSNRFGERLYRIFFKSYTEKVWGIPCGEIRAEWAAQRIKGLSLVSAVSNALFGSGNAKTLINEFDYPILGPGMMWSRFKDRVEDLGGVVHLHAEAVRLSHHDGMIQAVKYREGGETLEVGTYHVISTVPLNLLVEMLDPVPPEEVISAARGLSHRALVIVMLIVDREDLFPDQWIYVHSPDVMVGRIQNFRNWSGAMVPEPGRSSIGMEYFCDAGDLFWSKPDVELAEMAARELSLLGLADADDVVDSFVVRQPFAYPVYDRLYDRHLRVLRDYIGRFRNLQTIGRNGMHRYNNMDHSMLTGVLAAWNISGANHDLWAVNEESRYLEEHGDKEDIYFDRERVLSLTFARIDKLAFAFAVGFTTGLIFFIATMWLIIKGGPHVGAHLRLLAQFFYGYTVTVQGAFLAFAYSSFWGFLFGWLFAYVRNLFLAAYLYKVRKKAEYMTLRDFFDNL